MLQKSRWVYNFFIVKVSYIGKNDNNILKYSRGIVDKVSTTSKGTDEHLTVFWRTFFLLDSSRQSKTCSLINF